MKIGIKPDGNSEESDLQFIKQIIASRKAEADEFKVDLEEVEGIDLASFNTLVKLYVQVKRMDKEMVYVNCKSQKLRDLIDKTHFSDVFIKD